MLQPLLRTLRRPARAVAAVALLALGAAPASAQRTFTSFTAFGDSFSDSGNLSALLGGLFPPGGRVSNGPVFTEYLADRVGHADDAAASLPIPFVRPGRTTGVYAIAGAFTDTEGLVGGTGIVRQIDVWGARRGGAPADATGLYSLFAGGNDLRAAAALGDDVVRRTAAAQVAANVLAQVDRLQLAGVGSLLLPYMPDLGMTPDRRDGPLSGILTDLTGVFNATLAAGIAERRLARPTQAIYDLRLDNLFANLLAGPGRYGFTNVADGCAGAGALPACEGYLFFDGLHPTTVAHALVADAAYDLVAFDRNVARDPAVVPEPATVALLAGGLVVLGGLGAARRRRAA